MNLIEKYATAIWAAAILWCQTAIHACKVHYICSEHFKGVHFEKHCTKMPFLVYCGLLSAIKQPRMVQLIRSNIQNYRFYVETFSQDLDFWFQHLKGVHFGKNDTRISFLVVINECITMTKVRVIHLRWLEDNSKSNSGHTFSRKWFSSLIQRGHCCHCGASQKQ